ncbi:hypothetical protein WJ0W_006064 [Paenibacillus melissococcoides]|uniref:Uncharacterized protein n=1 Tax=Paenibacillus melissococcoides TaxID=2912268 RepID=A0ABM9G9Y1_9BACL|nr:MULTISPECIES: hypothetical protein [Paenibacillus]MEB9894618.1 hypothetical protein [Bacillus cereus]CAH8248880.1 hypothetical protein WJ0W_006064 [Paenibacillus melissococcoides]CAH8720679.1 hypothetical protein HTL2_006016 [Paenibacillus melissococcoides]CAH8720962.1 hypothetical protein WDD9_006066 [Paenibacillus melissococcoides]
MIFLKISVDGAWEEKEFHSAKEVNDFWVARTIPILESDRLIYSVQIDDNKYYSDYESIILENYHRINEIHIVTHTKEECFIITLEDLKAYLPRVVTEIPEIAEKLYAEEISEIGALITPIIDSLQWIVSALEFAYAISEKVNNANQLRHSIEQLYKNIESFIEQFHDQLSWNNYVGVSDLLQYELVPTLEGWINEVR